MTDIDNVQTIVNTAIAATDPTELIPGHIYAWMTPDGTVEQIDLTGDEHLELPARKKGTVRVEDLASFLAYWRKHSDNDSELYVDIKRHQITGVLDAHTSDDNEDGARWGQHRLILTMPVSQRWADWTGNDRKPLKQLDWAEFVEDHLDDIRDPSAASMLEIAQTFQSSTSVKFQSSNFLANGDRRLIWQETTGATAGEEGKLVVPGKFTIGIAPFDFAEPYEVTARFRYRVQIGELRVSYLLDDPDAVIRDAVLDVVGQLEAALSPTPPAGQQPVTTVKVMRGTPIGITA